MKMRDLKTWPEFFGAILDGSKSFEIRVGDFVAGEALNLREFVPCATCNATGEHPNGLDACENCDGTKGSYTGAEQAVAVTYVTSFGQPYGQKVLGIQLLS